MQQHLIRTKVDAVVIFGSSFPNDQEYTQVKSMKGKSANTPVNFRNNTLLFTEL